MSMKILPSNYVALKNFMTNQGLSLQFAYHNVTNYTYFLRSLQFSPKYEFVLFHDIFFRQIAALFINDTSSTKKLRAKSTHVLQNCITDVV